MYIWSWTKNFKNLNFKFDNDDLSLIIISMLLGFLDIVNILPIFCCLFVVMTEIDFKIQIVTITFD